QGRDGHRGATMTRAAYRHGLRASEVCDLQWQQIELSEGRLHVHRVKNGIPSVHPIRGDEMRALRKLRLPQEAYVFVSERGGPISPIDFLARPPRCHSRSTHTCFAMPAGSSSPMMATTRAPCSTISGTRTSSTRSGTPKWRRTASRIFGANWRRQASDRLPLDHALRLGLSIMASSCSSVRFLIALLCSTLFLRGTSKAPPLGGRRLLQVRCCLLARLA